MSTRPKTPGTLMLTLAPTETWACAALLAVGIAALLASNFPEAAQTERQALMYAALVLLAITLVVNVLGTLILVWNSRKLGKA